MAQRMKYWRETVIALLISSIVFLLLVTMPPVADDWGPLTSAALSVHAGSAWRQPFVARDVHWSPLWFLVNAIAYWLSPGTFGVLPLAFVKSVALMVLLIAAFMLLRYFHVRLKNATVSVLTLAFHQASVGGLYQWKAAGGLCSCAVGAVAITLIALAILATVPPAARARRVNPAEAMRAE